MSHVWLVTVPNRKESPNTTYHAIANDLEAKGQARVSRFKIPELVVGTLDSLMALSDDLSKIGTQVENVVRKVERQYIEIAANKAQSLRVNEKAIEATFRKFQWDFAQYQCQGKPLTELVTQIQAIAGKTEEELKVIATSYTEKNLALTAAKRRQIINFATSDFEDILTVDDIAKIDVQNTESLLTVMVVVPKSLEQEFLNTYGSIGEAIAAYGGPDWSNIDDSVIGRDDGKYGPSFKKRTAVRGSPVVPKSKKKVAEENDSCLYAITILRGHYSAGYYTSEEVFVPGNFVDYLEPMKAAFREKRFLVRELAYDSAKVGGIEDAIARAKEDVKQTKVTSLRWCKSHFGEIYLAWIHLKVIQAFVESVLRYGLPVDFVSLFIESDNRYEKEVRRQLLKTILALRPEMRPKKSLLEEDEEEGNGDGGPGESENTPYVSLKLSIIGNVANGSGASGAGSA